MICDHPQCTGKHGTQFWGQLCPAAYANKLAYDKAYCRKHKEHRTAVKYIWSETTAKGLILKIKKDAATRGK